MFVMLEFRNEELEVVGRLKRISRPRLDRPRDLDCLKFVWKTERELEESNNYCRVIKRNDSV
jgi:hypothetical protein